MTKYIFLTFFAFQISFLSAQEIKPFQFYNQKGKTVKFDKMLKDLANYDVVFIGEHHNNSINHWLQLRITKALFEQKNGQLTLGAEMFERDNQTQLNDYLSGKLNEKVLKDSMRLWNNYEIHCNKYPEKICFHRSKKRSGQFEYGNRKRKSLDDETSGRSNA